MRALRHGALGLLVCAALLPSIATAADIVTGEVLVELAPGVAPSTIADRYQLTLLESLDYLNLHLFDAGSAPEADATIERMNGDADVLDADLHRRLDTPEGVQRSLADLDFTAQPIDFIQQPLTQQIGSTAAQQRYTGRGVTVAILDTGMAMDHPSIAWSVVPPGVDLANGDGTAANQANGLDDDGDGLIDESAHHGTFVAGLIRLVAPKADIVPIRVLEEDGKGTAFAVANGIRQAVLHGADVINLSIGMADESRAVEKAIEDAIDAGVVVIAAAGNQGLGVVDFPALHEEVIAVAAVNGNGVRSDFSNYGPEVDLSAPGESLLSSYGDSGLFARWEGTSFAAPLVSGAVALLLEKYPGLDAAAVRAALNGTAQPDANPDLVGMMGAGVLDVDALSRILTDDTTSLRLGRSGFTATLSFSPTIGGPVYDVARGDLAALTRIGPPPSVGLGDLVCLANDAIQDGSLTVIDVDVPATGQAYFYLFREDPVGLGGPDYGQGSGYAGRLAGAADCSDSP